MSFLKGLISFFFIQTVNLLVVGCRKSKIVKLLIEFGYDVNGIYGQVKGVTAIVVLQLYINKSKCIYLVGGFLK